MKQTGKRAAKNGVDQLVLQIIFPEDKDQAEGTVSNRVDEIEDNGPQASTMSLLTGSETERKHTPPKQEPEQRQERKRKWYSLIDKVYALPNLLQAWEKVRANRGAPGIDGITIRKFGEGAEERLKQLSGDLRSKTYRPQAVRRVYIPKSGGGKRPLGIPTVRDRIVQQAVLQILSPVFEMHFSKHSHGFRPERGCATALDVVDRAVKHGYGWVVDADIENFFDTVDHDKLLAAVNEEISDGSVLRLLRQILEAGVIQPGAAEVEPPEVEPMEVEPTEKGTPQGGPLSPLLANIYLHHFDKKMEQSRYGLVRYADDFVIFTKSESEAKAAMQLAQEILEGEWGLKMHPEKTRVVSVDEGFEFLGFHYFRDPKSATMRKEVRSKSLKSFRDSIRKRSPRFKGQRKPKARHITPKRLTNNQELREIIRKVNLYLKGWHWYFKAVWIPHETPFERFDSFTRRRIRAAVVGRTGAGWWNVRITNALLRQLGLMGLDELQRRYLQGQLLPPARKG